MNPQSNCPKCGANLSPDAPGGVCPRCVLELGWGAASEGNAGSSGNDPGPTSGSSGGFVPPSPGELAPHFPQLEILELLGRGGMGAVYKARQRALDRLVAVKVLPPEVGRDAAFAERFTREARALARLSHPNIVAIHDVGQTGDYYYFVMEFVDGANLRTLMRDGALQPAEALAIVPQVCEALQFAHDEGIVHRDIKPENILVDKKGRVKIADFGLAKLVGAAPSVPQLTGTYQVMGTFHYMAPEQFERPQEVDHRADIYSLGVVLYELLTHELPIGRFSLPSQKVQIDVRLDDVVLRALEKDPPRRYQHASDIKTDVDTIVRSAAKIPPVVPLPAVEVVPQGEAPPAGRALSVPVKIDNLWGGFAEGHGVLRFDGEVLLIEYDVRENLFQALRLGSHHAPIGLCDLSAVTFKPGWWAHTVTVQVSRFQTIANLPGCDRGQIKLTIAAADRALGEKLAEAARLRLTGESWTESLAKAESRSYAPHTESPESEGAKEPNSPPAKSAGLILIAAVMLLAALTMLFLAISKYPHVDSVFHSLFWPGIGLLLGGGGCMYAAIDNRRRTSHAPIASFQAHSIGAPASLGSDEATDAPSPVGAIVAGAMMLLAAFALLGLAFLAFVKDDRRSLHAFLWPGIGLLIGGGGSLSSGIEARRRWSRQNARLGKPNGGDARLHQAQSALSLPGLGLLFASGCDGVALMGLVGTVGYLVWEFGPPPNMLWAYGTALLTIRLACAPLQFAAARAMRRLANRRLAMLGSVVALVPGSPGWLVGFPMGLWGLVVLRRASVREGFAAQDESRPRAGLVAIAPIVVACVFAVGFPAWTYATLPPEAATSHRADRWVTHSEGNPRLTEEYIQRLELRPAQVQAVNDLLETAFEKYRQIEVGQARLDVDSTGGRVVVVIGPFATRLASLESRTRRQIDLVLDERQRGLARQCDLFADLFLAGRGRVTVTITSAARGDETTRGPGRVPGSREPYFIRDVERETWLSGTTSFDRGSRLPLNLQAYWNQVAPQH